MRRSVIPILCLSLLLAGAAEARWFAGGAGRSGLRQIARSLAATPDGEVSQDSSLTRPPEPPVPPPQAMRRKHSPALTAEAAKSAAFAGPGEGTAMVEVGLEADKARAAALAGESGVSPESPAEAEPAAPTEPPADAPAAIPAPEAPLVFP